jgi:hypothetical protein
MQSFHEAVSKNKYPFFSVKNHNNEQAGVVFFLRKRSRQRCLILLFLKNLWLLPESL